MVIETVLYGKIEVPDTKEEIERELRKAKILYAGFDSRYRQARIDALEEALDRLRRNEDV